MNSLIHRLRAIAAGNAVAVRPLGAARCSVPMLPYDDPLRGVPLNPRVIGGRQRRSRAEIIEATNGYERDTFLGQPNVGKSREGQKAALQAIMPRVV